MPKGRPNSYAGGGFIKSMREKHEPHMKLAGKVENLEKSIPIELAQLHKTLSKSFGMQRKTLVRVLALENRLSNLEFAVEAWTLREGLRRQEEKEAQATVEDDQLEEDQLEEGDDETPESLDDVRSGVKGGIGIKKIPKKKPVAKKKKISAADLKKGSSQETIDDRIKRLEQNARDSAEGEIHQTTAQYKETNTGLDPETGEQLSPEERKRRFLEARGKKITADTFKKGTSAEGAEKVAADTTGASDLVTVDKPKDLSSGVKPVDEEGGEKPSNILSGISGSISVIADTVDSIYKTLQDQFKVQEDTKEDARIKGEEQEVKAAEKDLEKKKGLGGKIKDTAAKVFKPFMSIWDRFIQFFTAIIAGKVIMPLLDWFGDPKNKDKVSSLFRFISDWWPVLLGSLMWFLPGLLGPAGMIAGTIALLMWGVPKIMDAVKFVMDLPGQIVKMLTGGGKELEGVENEAVAEITKDVDVPVEEAVKSENPPPSAEMGDKPPVDAEKVVPDPKAKKFNKGGEVPGTGDKDTVPAMLTPGEFVMSKGAVQEYGMETLAGMNAAAGGTNIPTLQKDEEKKKGKGGTGFGVPRYSGGGQGGAIDKSHYGTMGYRIGQIMPEQYIYSKDTFKHHMVTKGDEVIKNEESLTSIGGAIGVPDLMEHQKQLVGEIQKHEGYENINIIDVMQRANGQGRLVGMPDETLYPILNSSDAFKATGAKIEAAHKVDLASRGITDPSKGYSMMYNGGGLVGDSLVQHFNQGGLVQHFNKGGMVKNIANKGNKLFNMLPQVKAAKWLGGKAGDAFNMLPQVKAAKWLGGKAMNAFQKGKEFIGNKVAGISPPASNESKVTVIQTGAPPTSLMTAEPGGSKIPDFPVVYPARKNNKQKLLGVTV